jgi:hypothetical protein
MTLSGNPTLPLNGRRFFWTEKTYFQRFCTESASGDRDRKRVLRVGAACLDALVVEHAFRVIRLSRVRLHSLDLAAHVDKYCDFLE